MRRLEKRLRDGPAQDLGDYVNALWRAELIGRAVQELDRNELAIGLEPTRLEDLAGVTLVPSEIQLLIDGKSLIWTAPDRPPPEPSMWAIVSSSPDPLATSGTGWDSIRLPRDLLSLGAHRVGGRVFFQAFDADDSGALRPILQEDRYGKHLVGGSVTLDLRYFTVVKAIGEGYPSRVVDANEAREFARGVAIGSAAVTDAIELPLRLPQRSRDVPVAASIEVCFSVNGSEWRATAAIYLGDRRRFDRFDGGAPLWRHASNARYAPPGVYIPPLLCLPIAQDALAQIHELGVPIEGVVTIRPSFSVARKQPECECYLEFGVIEQSVTLTPQ
ncbi:hypothetical protein RAS1_29770 [Phycisphaerae bacterium RAS1]|nr:hypothetical protein RAS1_29770 [Phycisphaerae bacterium RAS1]